MRKKHLAILFFSSVITVGAFFLLLTLGIPRAVVAFFSSVIGYLFGARLEQYFQPSIVHVSGQQLITSEEARSHAPALITDEAGIIGYINRVAYQWGGIELSQQDCNKNFLYTGHVGSGKTLLIKLMMIQVMERMGKGSQTRMMVYDFKNELIPFLAAFNPYGGITITNPFDGRCKGWAIWKDISEPRHAETISKIFIPQEEGPNQFFSNSARLLVDGVMKSFIYTNLKREEEGKPRLEWYLRDVALAVRHPKTCRAILNRHDELAHYIQFLERENNEVLVTVLSHIIPFETIAALWDKQDLFSLVDWRDRNDQGVLLFGNDSESQGPITTMNSFLIERLFQVARNDSTRSGKHTAIFLDEVSNLDKLNGLDTITATGRDFGISMFLGFQSFSAMKAKYGEDIANKILNELSHRAYLRGEKGHVQWVSEQLGMREVRERTPSDGSSISWTKDGLTTGTQDGNSWPLKDAPVVKEGLIKTLSETNERNGLTGFFSSLKVTKGPWKHHYEWWDFREAIRTCSEPKKQPRHAREQILREWDILDYARLDLEVPVSLKPKGSNFKPPTKSKSLPSSPAPLQLPAAPEEQPPDAPKRKRPFKRW